jgi:hypothetical protein
MSTPEIIDISISKVPGSPTLMPKLSVSDSSDSGMIQLNNLPSDNTKKSVNFGPGADLLIVKVDRIRQNQILNYQNFRVLTLLKNPKMILKRRGAPCLNPVCLRVLNLI